MPTISGCTSSSNNSHSRRPARLAHGQTKSGMRGRQPPRLGLVERGAGSIPMSRCGPCKEHRWRTRPRHLGKHVGRRQQLAGLAIIAPCAQKRWPHTDPVATCLFFAHRVCHLRSMVLEWADLLASTSGDSRQMRALVGVAQLPHRSPQ